jgi:hypothetical protein
MYQMSETLRINKSIDDIVSHNSSISATGIQLIESFYALGAGLEPLLAPPIFLS